MKKYTCDINGVPVSFQCDETFEATTKLFCGLLQLDKEFVVAEDKRVQIGWGLFRFHQTEEGFQLLAPNLMKGSLKDETEDLSLFISVLFIQCRALDLAKAQATAPPVSFMDKVMVRKSALKAQRVYLQRCKPVAKGDSGWYLGTVGEGRSDNPEDYQTIHTYELLLFCKGAVQLLQLPVGTLAVLEDGKLVEAVDEKNQRILP